MIALDKQHIEFSKGMIKHGADINLLDGENCNILFIVLKWPDHLTHPIESDGQISAFLKSLLENMTFVLIKAGGHSPTLEGVAKALNC